MENAKLHKKPYIIQIFVIAIVTFIVFLMFQAYAHGFNKGRELDAGR